MKILHLACLNNDPEIQPIMDPKCNPVGGEPHICTDMHSCLRSRANYLCEFTKIQEIYKIYRL